MNKRSQKVSTSVVAITLVFYSLFQNYVSPLLTGTPGLGAITGILASIGFYVGLYQLITWYYYKYLHERFENEYSLSGEWVYKLAIADKNNNGNKKIRFGICKITKSGADYTFGGTHFNPDTQAFTSRFSSDHVIFQTKRIVIIYKSVGVDGDIFMNNGVYFLTLEGTPPENIYGVWSDVVPNKSFGDIMMQRRDKDSDKQLKDIGYPLNSADKQEMLNLQSKSNVIIE